MAKWCILLVVLALAVASTARNVPNDAGLKDQKNFMSYGGVGGYSGIGNNGQPFGTVGAGVGGAFDGGLGGGIGGTVSIGGPGGGGAGIGAGTGGGVLPHP